MNMILKFFIMLFLLMLRINSTISQVTQEWTERYSGSGLSIDGGNSILIDNEDNIIVGGGSYNSMNNYDYTIIKYASSGLQQWIVTYDGPVNGHDILNAITLDDSGNVYVTGESIGIGTGADYATIKYNKSGIQQWVARYKSFGNHRDAAYAITSDNLGYIYVTGESYGDYVTIKYNSSGVQQWVSRYTDGVAYAIAVDDSGNVFITGRSAGDYVTIKYNSLGVQQWVSRYNGPYNGDDFANSIGIDSLGNIYVSGSIEDELHYGDYTTIKYNKSGIEQWVRRYGGSGHFLDVAESMKVDKSGNVYVTGYSTESGQGYNMTTIKYNTNGDTLWKASYHNGLNEIAFALELDISGNVYVTGESDGNGTGDDYATVKYNSLGQQQWVKRYDYSGQFGDVAQAIAVDKNGNVYVTGSSDRDYFTIKYSQLTGINTQIIVNPSTFILYQNYPNPFNPSTVIRYSIPSNVKRQTSNVKLVIYNNLGLEINTIVNKEQNAGTYEVEFDGSNYPSGIYFYRLEVDEIVIDTKRMILLK